jgi:hypothetical protein
MESNPIRAALSSLNSLREAVGGEGGGRSSEGRKETLLPSFHPDPATVSALADVLRAVGIYVLSRERRDALALDLGNEGWQSGDVTALTSYLRAATDDAGLSQRQLAGRLTRAEGRREALDDLRARGPSPLRDLQPGEWIRRQNVEHLRQSREEWEAHCADVEAGRVERLPRLLHPWERRAPEVDA